MQYVLRKMWKKIPIQDEVCGGEIVFKGTPFNYDKQTGEEWYSLSTHSSCKKCEQTWTDPVEPDINVPVRKFRHDAHYEPFKLVQKKYFNNGLLKLEARCDKYICPQCNKLPKSSFCFIATAVYGSYNSPEVMILRSFRDEYLLKTYFGKLLVWFYYMLSPQAAKLIQQNKFLKKIIEIIVLKPILSFMNNGT
jgi:hypothetical protein